MFTALEDIGKTKVSDMNVLAEFRGSHGDLFVLDGNLNSSYGHGVPKVADTTVRVSLTFGSWSTAMFIQLWTTSEDLMASIIS